MMSTMRRLIVRAQFLTNPIYPNHHTRRRIKGSYAFSTIFNSYHDVLHLSGGYIECKHYHAEAAEIKGGGSDFKSKRSITKGDTISLNDLLFTSNRDYLIKNNNQYVKAEHLKDKVIGIYFLPLSAQDPRHSLWHTSLLKDVYDDLHPVNNFEVILVACNDPDTDFRAELPVDRSPPRRDSQKLFQDLFSCMPWTAIPFSDVTSRKHIQRSFGVTEEYDFQPIMYIVDQAGMVLQVQCSSWDIFDNYGALGYPFSDKRLKFLRTEDYLLSQQPSLKALLGSPKRDYIISNNGDKVPIHTFEDKVVALYFYQPDTPDSLTEELKLVYEEFARKKKLFEVVLVYIREPCQRYGSENLFLKSEESFWEVFKTMPWLALSFKDMSYKKLKRVFEFQSYDVHRLVIFGPHADYIEPFGCRMLLRYGIRAFPFTRKSLVELEIEKVKELNLGMLWNPNNVFRRNEGSQVPFSLLSGKRVVLVLERFDALERISDFSNNKLTKFLTKFKEKYALEKISQVSNIRITKFLTMLKEKYVQSKGTDDEFEVIRILTNYTESPIYKDLVGDLPWLVSPASELLHDLGSSHFWYGISTNDLLKFYFPMYAFNLDGRLVRKTLYPKFEDMEFPFCAGGLEEETASQLITLFWSNSSGELFRYNGRIYRQVDLNLNTRS